MDHPEMIMLTHQLEQGNLLFIMNPTDRSQTVFCRLSDLFGKEEWYQYCFSWEQKDTVSEQEDTVVRILAPHDSVLLFVTRKPLTRKPENLWNW